MKFKIHNHSNYTETALIEGKNMKECIEKANKECEKRNWESYWAEKILY